MQSLDARNYNLPRNLNKHYLAFVMYNAVKLESIPRKKSVFWKFTFWLLIVIIVAQTSWLATVPALRQTLKLERATPRVSWLEWPSEIDLQTPREETEFNNNQWPQLLPPRVLRQAGGKNLASLALKSHICWQNPPRVIEPWNIRMEMAVLLLEEERFLSTARGSMRPEYESKKLHWQNPDRCEAVVFNADFFVPTGKKFYGYILRLYYKEKMTSQFSAPPTLLKVIPSISSVN